MTPRIRAFAFIALVGVLLGMSAYVAARFTVTTDVTALMPPSGEQAKVALARRIVDSELSRTMVLTLGAPDADTAVRASRAFEAALREQRGVAAALASLEGGPPEGAEQAIYELYHPRRLSFLAEDPEGVREQLTPQALSQAAARLKQRLLQPMSTLLSRLAPSDPLLILTRLFEGLERSHGQSLRVEDGRFITRDGRFAVLFLATHARAFDSRAQAPLIEGIDRAFARVNPQFGGALSLDQSGVNRFAVRAERAIEGDIERVSTLAAVGFVLLFVALFRSLRLLALASLPLGAGFVAGTAVCLVVYGRVHGITLAFGASLLGVALDYVEHLYCHHAVAPDPEGPWGTLRALAPALVTGALTTLVGFLALGFAGLPGLSEVALFSSVGIVFALLASFVLLPPLLPREMRPVKLRVQVVALLERLLFWLSGHRRALWVLPALALGLSVWGALRVQVGGDFMGMGQLDQALLAEDQRVRERVSRYDQRRLVAAVGESDDAALEANDAVARALEAAVEAGELGGFRGVRALLPSPAQQRAVAEAARSALGDGSSLIAAFEAEGFRGDALRPFVESLGQPAPEPLTYEALSASPLASLVRPFRMEVEKGVAYVSFVHDVHDAAALEARLAAIPGAVFIDQGAALQQTYALYQERTLKWLGIGLLAVLVLLAVRYRDPKRTLVTFVPAALAAGVTVWVLALTGTPLDLVALTALLMVVSMGVDYGVFLVDALTPDEDHRATALLSVFLAATSTVLGFGLLALSEHPMLASIGITATAGMVASLLLAPTALVLWREDGASAARGSHDVGVSA